MFRRKSSRLDLSEVLSLMAVLMPSRFVNGDPLWRSQRGKVPVYTKIGEMSDRHLTNAILHEQKKGKIGVLERDKTAEYLKVFHCHPRWLGHHDDPRLAANAQAVLIAEAKTLLWSLETDPWMDLLRSEAFRRGLDFSDAVCLNVIESYEAQPAEEYHV